MPTKQDLDFRWYLIAALSVALVLGPTLAGGKPAQNSGYQLELVEAPDTVEVGETATFQVRVSVPESAEESEFVGVSLFTFHHTGEDFKSVTLSPGESQVVTFNVRYDQAHTQEVVIGATVDPSGEEIYREVTSDITVVNDNPTQSSPDPEFESPSSSEKSAPPQNEQAQTRTHEGVAIPIASEVQADFLTALPGDQVTSQNNLFFLVTNGSLRLVITDEKPIAGQATIQSNPLGQVPALNSGGQISVIRANSASFTTEGQQVSARKLEDNPEQYHLELVRTRGYHSQVSMRFDPDQGSNITRPTTTGYFSQEPPADSSGVSINYYNQVERLRNTSIELSQSYGDQSALRLSSAQTYYPPSPSFATYTPSSTFWATQNHTVDAIFIDPGSTNWDSPVRRALRMARPADQTGQFQLDGYLYVVNSGPTPGTEATIQNIRDHPEQYQGQTVTIEGYFGGQKMSVQELIEHNTPCGQDYAQVPSSGGPSCVDLVIDSVVYTGVMASDDVSSRSDIMPVIGFSGEHQDTQQTTISGRYQLTGRVIQVGDISEKLPGTTALVINGAEKIGDGSQSSMKSIRNERERLLKTVRALLLNEDVPKSVAKTQPPQQTQSWTTTRSTTPPENQDSFALSDILIILNPTTVIGVVTWSGILLLLSLVLLFRFAQQTIDRYF